MFDFLSNDDKKYKEKIALNSIGTMLIKSKKTKCHQLYTCRYSSGYLSIEITLFLIFITMILIDCKIKNFSLILACLLFYKWCIPISLLALYLPKSCTEAITCILQIVHYTVMKKKMENKGEQG